MGKGNTNNNASERTPSNLPATEIVKNPNPRANENIHENDNEQETTEERTTGVGSEITDGEDA
jgi:hypothetical protein